MGPPGAGKGTQAALLAKRLGVPHVASGNLLRETIRQGTPLGAQAKTFMDRGDLVPDDLVKEIVATRIEEADAEGFVLDGYPRTASQAEAFDHHLVKVRRPILHVISLDVPQDELIARLTGRRFCPVCQRSYHMIYNSPASDEVCDEDGTPLTTRNDDSIETVRHRLDVYNRDADGLAAYYEQAGLLTKIPGVGDMEEVAEKIRKAIEAGP